MCGAALRKTVALQRPECKCRCATSEATLAGMRLVRMHAAMADPRERKIADRGMDCRSPPRRGEDCRDGALGEHDDTALRLIGCVGLSRLICSMRASSIAISPLPATESSHPARSATLTGEEKGPYASVMVVGRTSVRYRPDRPSGCWWRSHRGLRQVVFRPSTRSSRRARERR